MFLRTDLSDSREEEKGASSECPHVFSAWLFTANYTRAEPAEEAKTMRPYRQ